MVRMLADIIVHVMTINRPPLIILKLRFALAASYHVSKSTVLSLQRVQDLRNFHAQ